MAQIEKGNNQLTKAVIRSANGYTAEIYTHGAHVTSWKTPNNEDLLFLSKNAIFNPPTAIRGGIPICWPQFSDMGPCKTQHGFARNTEFEIIDSSPDSVTMELKNDDQGKTLNFSPPSDFSSQKFILICKVSLHSDGSLHQELSVRNPATSTEPLTFTCALHTYFNLRTSGGIEHTIVENLKGVKYLDSLQGRKECVEAEEKVHFHGEVDRIYLNVPDTLRIIEQPEKKEKKEEEVVDTTAMTGIKIEKNNFSDAVVWNPHAVKASKMADFGDDEWKQMVCVEVAQAGSGPIQLKPGETWIGSQKLSILP